MAAMPSMDDTPYSILVQVLIALGQGAAPVIVSREVILAATKQYTQAARDSVADWDERAPGVCSWAQAIGALGAHYALGQGRALMTLEDYEAARRSAGAHTTEARGRCRWT